MRLMQFYDGGRIRVGLVQSDTLVPIAFNGDMMDFIACGIPPVPVAAAVPLAKADFAPPVTRPSKIIAIGLNYKDHAHESKGEIPKDPLVFAKFPNSIIGHGQDIVWDDRVTKKVDFEAELTVIIGKKVRTCDEKEAMDAVFGYTCGNDVSARDLQFSDRQWVRSKSLDTFCPIGPWIVTPEDLPHPHSLHINCTVNNTVMQESNTERMVFNIPSLICFLSAHFTLLPGDIILTGTPQGVGAFRKPPVYLKHGDEVCVAIEGIGRLVNRCRIKTCGS